jgi:hypothetical protein
MSNRTISTRYSATPTNENPDSPVLQASGDVDTIGREWLGLRDLT